MEERLQKFLARAGISSRRGAEELISKGEIRVNGKVVTELGTKINPAKDRVTYQKQLVQITHKKVYYILNKPKGYISTVKDDRGRKTVVDILSNVEERIFPIGRLDYNTEGLLLLTNDGDFMQKLIHPKYEIEKTYVVKIGGRINEEEMQKLADGVMLDGRKTSPATIYYNGYDRDKQISDLEITIHEGRNRQVRRMFEAIGYEVKALKRITFAGLTLNGLPRGRYRQLYPNELKKLRALIGEK